MSILNHCQHGDILHFRTSTFFGKAIRKALPCWGNHDAILVEKDGEWGVAEAVIPRFRFTPWEVYQKEIDAGETSVVVLRHKDATVEDGVFVDMWALKCVDIAPKYD